MAAKTQPQGRSRVRAVDVSESEASSIQIVDNLLTQLAQATDRKNAATNEERKLQKKLEEAMVKSNILDRSLRVGNFVRHATVAEREKEVVNVEKLANMVERSVFLDIVSATQTAVKEAVGSNVLQQVLDKEKTPASLKVERVKD